MVDLDLQTSLTAGARVEASGPGCWRLEIPAGPAGRYRLAQVDDYHLRRRQDFHWSAPIRLSLKARASGREIPGTWGFGLWNDPFSMALLGGGGLRRLPCLPNTAWFFYAAPPNYLSLRDDLPTQGFLAATFRGPDWPAWKLALGAPALTLAWIRPVARALRRSLRKIVQQEAALLTIDPTEWHTYQIEWQEEVVEFQVDGVSTLRSATPPNGRLGLVLWVDNQYAATPPEGRLRYGTLENKEPAWLEVAELDITMEATQKRPRAVLDNPPTSV